MLFYNRVQLIWMITTTICCGMTPVVFTITLSQSLWLLLTLVAWLAAQALGYAVSRGIQTKVSLVGCRLSQALATVETCNLHTNTNP